jgi:hypothetical protein
MAEASNTILSLLHLPAIDSNFLLCSARNQEELDIKCVGTAGSFVKDRQMILARYLQEAERDLAIERDTDEDTFRVRRSTIALLREKLADNTVLYQIYGGTAVADVRTGFFEASKKAWEITLPDVLQELELRAQGSFVLAPEIVRLAGCCFFGDLSSDVN